MIFTTENFLLILNRNINRYLNNTYENNSRATSKTIATPEEAFYTMDGKALKAFDLDW